LLIGPLAIATKQWGDLTMKLAQNIQSNPEELGAAANDYLYYSGYVAIAYLLAKGVAAAETSTQCEAVKQAKRATARFHFARLLPRCLMHQAAIEAGIATIPLTPDRSKLRPSKNRWKQSKRPDLVRAFFKAHSLNYTFLSVGDDICTEARAH
jgi:hypothetical protein